MSDDLEQMLRQTLAAHARQAPEAPDLTEPVIERGRTIRRRRRVAGVAAAALATVGVTGAALQLAGPGSREEAMPASGGSAAVQSVVPRAELTTHGVVVRTAKGTVALPAEVRSVLDIERAGGSFVVLGSSAQSAAESGGSQQLLVVPEGGQARAIASGAITSFAVSGDGSKVAYVGSVPGASTQVRVRSVADGQLIASTDAPAAGVASAWDGADVLVTSTSARSLYRWTPGGSLDRTDAASAVAVPGGSPLFVVGSCLRRALEASDLVCGQRLTTTVAPDGTTAVVHALDDSGRDITRRVDIAESKVANVPLPQEVASEADWAHAVWTTKKQPLVKVGGTWRLVNLQDGTAASAALPDDVEDAIRW